MFEFIKKIPSPEELKQEIPLPERLLKIKQERDGELKSIFEGKSGKFLMIIGPCSADNEDAVCEYVGRLAALQEKVKEKIFIIPRIYTNKPRTNGLGYKGMLHQPEPGSEPDIYTGIKAIRHMQVRAIGESHLTAADEMLYPENIVYFDDLLSYHAVGARSVENQLHRLASSGIDAPVGMKNPTSGDFNVMFNSIVAAQNGHMFMYRESSVRTNGNPLTHAILRGYVSKHGENLPNYHYEDLTRACKLYDKLELKNPALIIDVNHSNSDKRFGEQTRICMEAAHSRAYSPGLKKLIKGFMVESYLEEGSQSIGENMVYGRSITDPCLGWAASERLVLNLAEKL
ncbi:MAG: 3-deoxy-7-phosphoheptulonate synthase [Oscillospiraceae bacterium]|jgi:3-deoxy-7-phosphoheptulonate synthase|nr:3-deoxy-7-phosphoheptulonate synthase [Oscillospiraceae bacterium]